MLFALALAVADVPGASAPWESGPIFVEELPEIPVVPSATPEIVNGVPASDDVFDMTGGLLVAADLTVPDIFGGGMQQASIKQMACSSTLIAPDVVLLAAHCVDPAVLAQGGTAENIEFRWSRKANLREPSSPFDPWPNDAIKATKAVFHDEWDPNNLSDLSVGDRKYDIALLFLEEAVLDVKPAVVVTEEEASLIKTGLPVEIVGWGIDEPVSMLESLFPDSESYGKKRYAYTYLGDVGKFEIQVGKKRADGRKCKGDSGGPTFMTVDDPDEPRRIIGVTSRSADFTQCEETGGYDTRVDAYLAWIDATMAQAWEDGDRPACVDCDATPGIIPPGVSEAVGGCSTTGAGVGVLATLGLLFARRRGR